MGPGRRAALLLSLAVGCTAHAETAPPAATPTLPPAFTAEDLALAFGGATPSPCAGARVDLDDLVPCRCVRRREVGRMVYVESWCGEAFDAPDASLETRLEASPAEVASGEPVELHLHVRNTLPRATTMMLRRTTGIDRIRVFDAHGEEVTWTGTCAEGASSQRDARLVVLLPGGEGVARRRWLPVSRHGEVGPDGCRVGDRPLLAGRYRVEVDLGEPGRPHPVSATITVR